MNPTKIIVSLVPALLVATVFQGCAGRQAVVAATGTVIGVDISENPQTQLYHAKLGYNRGELAIVPSNRSGKEDATRNNSLGDGAKDTTDVLMELRYAGIFSKTDAAIYQRLAVGRTAVSQPGAAFLLAKDSQGKIDAGTAKALGSAVGKIPAKDARARFDSLNGVVSYLRALPPEKYPEAAGIADKVKSLGDLVPANWDFTRYSWTRANLVKIDDSVAAPPLQGYPKFKNYRDTLDKSVKTLAEMKSPPGGGPLQVDTPVPAALTAGQLDTAEKDRKAQPELLQKIDQKFADNPDVDNAFAYFNKVTSNTQ